MIRNITFTADKALIDDARAVAAEDNTTLNEKFRIWLEGYARRRKVARAMEVLDRLGKYASTGGRKFNRDEMNERVDFLDTDVLVYAIDAAHPGKKEFARGIVVSALTSDSAVISFQVVREALQIMTRKACVIASEMDAATFLEAIVVPSRKLHPCPGLYRRALESRQSRASLSTTA